MKKTTLIDKATAPDGGVLSLYEQDGHYTIRVGSSDLMSTRRFASEQALARIGCSDIPSATPANVLIGGLGFGYTLREVLALVGQKARVTVAELIPKVVEWNANQAFPLAHEALKDSRVSVVQNDVFTVLQNNPATYDRILLDTDNGPAALSTESNGRLYTNAGLRVVKRALRPGGWVVVWSASEDPAFVRRLSQEGFEVEVCKARAHATSGSIHTLFLGRLK